MAPRRPQDSRRDAFAPRVEAVLDPYGTVACVVSGLSAYVPRVLRSWVRPDFERVVVVDGAFVYTDVSGFTKLSERLASRGKEGAEEVNAVVNGVWSILLAVIAEEGGDVYKFGGDSLFIAFDGDACVARACRAAIGMRRALRAHGPFVTEAGPVRLRVTSGVHTGRAHAILAGDLHDELLIVGPGVTQTLEAEALATHGQVVVTNDVARAIPRRMLRDGNLLRDATVTALEGAARRNPAPAAGGVSDDGGLARFFSRRVGTHLLAGPPDSEHRQAVIAFIDVRSTDEVLRDEGAAALARRLHDVVSTTQAAAENAEVSFLETDVGRGSVKIVLVAGVPTSTGSDEDRMLAAALGSIAGRAELPVQVGVNRGRIFAGVVGTEWRRTYACLGDTTNVAARLAARAPTGGVLCATDVLDRARTEYAIGERDAITVKGRAQPVQVAVPERALGPKPGLDHRTPLIGREREVEELLDQLRGAREGRGGAVEIIGEPGMGKSRLAEEIADRANGFVVRKVTCAPYAATSPFLAIRSITPRPTQSASFAEPMTDALTLVHGGALRSDSSLAARGDARVAEQIRALVVESIDADLRNHPVLLVVEDAQWCDEASSSVLADLANLATCRPWLCVSTARPGTRIFASAREMRLEPLSKAASVELARHVAVKLFPDQIDAVAARSAGNPLFLQELAAAAYRGAAHDALTDTVEAMMAARLDVLAPDDRRALRSAAAVGVLFDADLVADVTGDAQLASPTRWAALAELVEPTGPSTFRFRHALVRDAAYEGLPYRQRRALHGRIAEALERATVETGEGADLLSLHFFAAGMWDAAWRYGTLAGKRAQAAFAPLSAAAGYRRALEAARRLQIDPAERAEIWQRLAVVLEIAGRLDEAAHALAAGRRLISSVADRARFAFYEGELCERRGAYARALRWYRRGLIAIDEADPASLGTTPTRLLLAVGFLRFRQGKVVESIDWYLRAERAAERVDDRAGLAHACAGLYLALTAAGDPGRATYRGRAAALYEEVGDLAGLANTLNAEGIEAYYEGRWDDAVRLYERAGVARASIGDTFGQAEVASNIGEVLSDQGRLDEASAQFDVAESIYSAASEPLGAAVIATNRGRLAARAGRLEEAEHRLNDAAAELERIGAADFAALARAYKAEAWLLAGRALDAEATMDDLLLSADRIAVPGLVPLALRIRGASRRRRENIDGATEDLQASVARARSEGSDYHLALGLLALDVDDAEGRQLAARLGLTETAFSTATSISGPPMPRD